METPCSFSIILLLNYLLVCLARNTIFTDQEALLALKSSINLDPFRILESNWSSSANNTVPAVCQWVGVSCSSRHNRVAALDISNMGLSSAQIPPQIGSLSFLVSLNLSKNHFRGNLPPELARLHRLRFFDLGYNSLTGIIPPEIGSLQKLQYLSFENNHITGPLPESLLNISSLQQVRLRNNSLTGTLPENMCSASASLPSLEMFDVSRNYLEGLIPASIEECASLNFLSFSGNGLTGSIPREMGNLTKLRTLYIFNNRLTGPIPEEIGNLHQLEEFQAANNSLSGVLPLGLFNISSLRGIGLSMNQLSGTLPTDLGSRLPNLEYLYINMNNLEGQIPSSVSNSSKLLGIALDANKLSGPIPSSLGSLRSLQLLYLMDNVLTGEPSSSELSFITSLTNCRNLTLLAVGDNLLNGSLPSSIGNFSSGLSEFSAYRSNLRGGIPMEIGNLNNLIALNIFENDLTGSVPETIRNLGQLQLLSVAKNKLNGSIPDGLCDLPNLFKLFLGGNQFSGSLPECLGSVDSLRYLNVEANRLSSSVPESLWSLKNLLQLNLSQNSFTGDLPPRLSSMESMIFLDLSMNNFSGNIPNSTGDLTNLLYLSLAQNRIEGSIPEALGKIPHLEFLNLSANNLSGVIPKSLEAIDTLEYFNVSFNQLEGQIPSGGPFQNFTPEFFMSNKGFCGGAPQLDFESCPPDNVIHKSNQRKVIMICLVASMATVAVLLAIFIFFRKRFWINKVRTQGSDPSPDTNMEKFSYYELRQATSGFSESNLLGTGSFGSVYKATFENGEVYAVKVFKQQQQDDDAFKSFGRECLVLRNIRHRNLVKVISSCSNLDFKSLVLQYMPNGSLEKWLYEESCVLDFMQRLDVMVDVGCALEYLHHGYSTPVVHCDLKPSNVLLDVDLVAHVADFGISQLLEQDKSFAHTNTLATFGYMAPEYGIDGLVSTRCDVYSFGIMMMEVFTRKRPSDEMFSGDVSLRKWVSDAVRDKSIAIIIDADLLKSEEIHSGNKKVNLVWLVLELGLSCTSKSPDRRINMRDATTTLRKIKSQLLAI